MPVTRRRLLSLIATASLAATAGTLAGTSGTAGASTTSTTVIHSPGPAVPGLDCPPEQFPSAGSPRNAPSVPYEIPFTATLGQKDPTGLTIGGYLQIANSLLTATLGGPIETDTSTQQPYGSIFAKACGLVQLPSEQGGISAYPTYGAGVDPTYNNNFVFQNPISVSLSLTGFTGLPVLEAYGSANGNLAAAIERTPAANGGLNVVFYGNAKSTSTFGAALGDLAAQLTGGSPALTLPAPIASALQQVGSTGGSSCTITIGNEITEGTPARDVAGGVTGLTYAQATSPVLLTTQSSGHLSGRPVTGPVTASNATLVANDFAVGAIDPNTVPAESDTAAANAYAAGDEQKSSTQQQPCSSGNASLLNQLLGLPSIPDAATGHYPNAFYAPSTFDVFTSS
jgi:hypothetical protein